MKRRAKSKKEEEDAPTTRLKQSKGVIEAFPTCFSNREGNRVVAGVGSQGLFAFGYFVEEVGVGAEVRQPVE